MHLARTKSAACENSVGLLASCRHARLTLRALHFWTAWTPPTHFVSRTRWLWAAL